MGRPSYEELYASFRWETFLKETAGWELGQPLNITQVVVDRHAHDPRRTALLFVPPEGEAQSLTYRELQVSTSQFANVLGKLGVRRGGRVARLLPRCPENYIAFLGTWRAGAVDMPLYTTFGPEAVAYRVKDSGATVLVTDTENREKLERIPGGLPGVWVITVDGTKGRGIPRGDLSFWEEVASASETYPGVETHETDLAVLQYTSGTTGPPKGAMITHGSILGLFSYVKNYLNLQEDARWWAFADPGWAYGLLTTGICVMGLGHALLIFTGSFDARGWYRVMERYGVTDFTAAPTAYRTIAAAGEDMARQHRLYARAFTSAGEYLNPEVSRWFQQQFGVPISDQYGVTETGMVLGNYPSMKEKPGSMGKPIPGFEVTLLDEQGREEVPPGQPGLVAVRRNRFLLGQGYWKSPDKWEQRFLRGEWFNTGDVATRDEEGYYFFKGRDDDVISSAGYRIGPSEVEDSLLEHPAVAEAAVVGQPDPLRVEVVKAFVVLKAGHPASEALAKELQEWVRERYSKHAYPREVEFIPELPKTESGKIKRRELRART